MRHIQFIFLVFLFFNLAACTQKLTLEEKIIGVRVILIYVVNHLSPIRLGIDID